MIHIPNTKKPLWPPAFLSEMSVLSSLDCIYFGWISRRCIHSFYSMCWENKI